MTNMELLQTQMGLFASGCVCADVLKIYVSALLMQICLEIEFCTSVLMSPGRSASWENFFKACAQPVPLLAYLVCILSHVIDMMTVRTGKCFLKRENEE